MCGVSNKQLKNKYCILILSTRQVQPRSYGHGNQILGTFKGGIQRKVGLH